MKNHEELVAEALLGAPGERKNPKANRPPGALAPAVELLAAARDRAAPPRPTGQAGACRYQHVLSALMPGPRPGQRRPA